MEKRYIRKDGTAFWGKLKVSIFEGKTDASQYVIAMLEDITERKKAERQLSLMGEITKNMYEEISLVRASDGIFVYANPKYEEMFGYGSGELVGKPVSICNAPSEIDPEETFRLISNALKEEGGWQEEVHNIKKDG